MRRFVEDMTPNDGYWTLTLPLATDGRTFGSISFFRGIQAEDVSIDLKNICGMFQQELGVKLAQLIDASEPEQASLAYQVQK